MNAMRSTWIWVGVVVVVLAIAGIWWYAGSTATPEAWNQQTGTTETTGTTATSSGSDASATETSIQTSGNSDAALDQDMGGITNQMSELSADAQAAATTSAQ